MAYLRRNIHFWPLLGFALLLLAPGLAIRAGVLPFELRFEALIVVTALCIGLCVALGFSRAELGLAAPWVARHWMSCAVITLALVASILLESLHFPSTRAQPEWLWFAPFYALVSSPCQEIVCRSIPKLITDRARLGGVHYVLFSAAVFSLMHLAYGDELLLANTFVAGAAWATAYLFTQNIWPLAASHAMVGTTAFWLGVA